MGHTSRETMLHYQQRKQLLAAGAENASLSASLALESELRQRERTRALVGAAVAVVEGVALAVLTVLHFFGG